VSRHTISDERSDLKDAALSLVVGECVGTGYQRHVYAIKGRNDLVMKIEHSQAFNNVTEWLVWQAVKGTPNAKWFAPCFEISHDGKALIQSRTQVFTRTSFIEAVSSIPVFFDDVHYGNWGMLDGHPVCHDYGYNHFIEIAARTTRMKKVRHPARTFT
jgi:hypothetical protein